MADRQSAGDDRLFEVRRRPAFQRVTLQGADKGQRLERARLRLRRRRTVRASQGWPVGVFRSLKHTIPSGAQISKDQKRPNQISKRAFRRLVPARYPTNHARQPRPRRSQTVSGSSFDIAAAQKVQQIFLFLENFRGRTANLCAGVNACLIGHTIFVEMAVDEVCDELD